MRRGTKGLSLKGLGVTGPGFSLARTQ
jgi:hypothetical protein